MVDIAGELTKLRLSSRKSQREFAELLGIPQTTWSGYEKGKNEPPMKVLLALAEKGYRIKGLTTSVLDEVAEDTGFSKDEIVRRLKLLEKLNLPPDMSAKEAGRIFAKEPSIPHTGNLKPVPVLAPSEISEGAFVVPLLDQKLSAGPGAYVPETDEAQALIQVPPYLSRYGKNIAALTVEGDSMDPTLKRGDMVVCDSLGWSGEGIYAVRMGSAGFVKRLTKAPGKIVILSDNPMYPPREEPEESTDFEIIGRVHCAITKME